MTGSEPGEGKLPTSPEELQGETRRVYLSLPTYVRPRERRKLYPDETTMVKADSVEIQHRLVSETLPIFVRKFQELISQADVTPKYRQTIIPLIELVHLRGRKYQVEGLSGDELSRALQIDSDTGIYTKDGAAKGEAFLFEEVLDDYLETAEYISSSGPFSRFLPKSSPGEIIEFLLRWKKEYEDHYGKPLDIAKIQSLY